MKRAFIAFAIAAALLPLAAQDIGSPDAEAMGVDTSQQELKLISVERFENAGFWAAYMSADEGLVRARLFEGKHPEQKPGEDPAQERYSGTNPMIPEKYVFGVRVDFFKRGFNEIRVLPSKPIPIEGITKIISVWVVGRNYNHELKLMLRDFFDNDFELSFGKLNFQGWRKLKVAVPPQNPDGRNGIIQKDYHYAAAMGLRITGFRIACDLMESYGTYYIYFDDMRAETDLFNEVFRDTNDMPDNW